MYGPSTFGSVAISNDATNAELLWCAYVFARTDQYICKESLRREKDSYVDAEMLKHMHYCKFVSFVLFTNFGMFTDEFENRSSMKILLHVLNYSFSFSLTSVIGYAQANH